MTNDTYLLKAADIDKMEVQEKQHFLNPNARVVNRSLGDVTGLTGFGFHLMEVQPGRDTTTPHFHYREDECVYILEGQGQAQIGDDVFDVSAGDFLGYRKGGKRHGLKNTGTTVMRCIVVGQRFDTDVVDYPEQGKRMFRTTDLPWNVVDLKDIKGRE